METILDPARKIYCISHPFVLKAVGIISQPFIMSQWDIESVMFGDCKSVKAHKISLLGEGKVKRKWNICYLLNWKSIEMSLRIKGRPNGFTCTPQVIACFGMRYTSAHEQWGDRMKEESKADLLSAHWMCQGTAHWAFNLVIGISVLFWYLSIFCFVFLQCISVFSPLFVLMQKSTL